MRNLKFLTHPALVLFTAFAFLFLVTGCTRTVTKYDANGKPYTDTEPDPWGTIGAFIITCLVLGGIAAAASSGGGSALPVEHKTLLAYAGNRGYITDASSGMIHSAKWFKLVDAKGNVISRHLIDVDRLMASRSLVTLSDVQITSKINKKLLRELVQEIAKANNLNSVPDSVKTEISYLGGEESTLRMDAVSIPKDKSNENRISELTIMSEKGIYRVTASMPEKAESENNLASHLSITVSSLN